MADHCCGDQEVVNLINRNTQTEMKMRRIGVDDGFSVDHLVDPEGLCRGFLTLAQPNHRHEQRTHSEKCQHPLGCIAQIKDALHPLGCPDAVGPAERDDLGVSEVWSPHPVERRRDAHVSQSE